MIAMSSSYTYSSLICKGMSMFSTMHPFIIQKEAVPYEIIAMGNYNNITVCMYHPL